MTTATPCLRRRLAVLLFVGLTAAEPAAGQQPRPATAPESMSHSATGERPPDDWTVMREAAARLPMAAVLGAVLAFRPRRRGTPPRTPAVIQTQILLAVVGALVMLVVGSSLARAFGIVGAAGLIRYRAKIEDPKDAGVMLATLGVGLASGVGLYFLAGFATVFFLVVLGIVESLHEGHKEFDLTVSAPEVERLRTRVEALLQRQGMDYELRSASEGQLCYAVKLPLERKTDRISNAIQRLEPEHPPAIGWQERKVKS